MKRRICPQAPSSGSIHIVRTKPTLQRQPESLQGIEATLAATGLGTGHRNPFKRKQHVAPKGSTVTLGRPMRLVPLYGGLMALSSTKLLRRAPPLCRSTSNSVRTQATTETCTSLRTPGNVTHKLFSVRCPHVACGLVYQNSRCNRGFL